MSHPFLYSAVYFSVDGHHSLHPHSPFVAVPAILVLKLTRFNSVTWVSVNCLHKSRLWGRASVSLLFLRSCIAIILMDDKMNDLFAGHVCYYWPISFMEIYQCLHCCRMRALQLEARYVGELVHRALWPDGKEADEISSFRTVNRKGSIRGGSGLKSRMYLYSLMVHYICAWSSPCWARAGLATWIGSTWYRVI